MSQTVERIVVDADHPDRKSIARAAKVLRKGGLVAFPTETVYGLGALGLDEQAVAKVFEAKGRPAWNPVILHVASRDATAALVSEWTQHAETLAKRFWPGPLTLVLRKSDNVPAVTTAGLDSVAVRVPAHPVALALLHEVGEPVAAPSANRFTHVSPTTADHVIESLGNRVDIVLDGGECPVGIESTVIDLTGAVPTVLRPGMISRQHLEDALGHPVSTSNERIRSESTMHSAARSPGMAIRHYAPRAEVWLIGASDTGDVNKALAQLPPKHRAVLIAMSDSLPRALTLPEGSKVFRLPQSAEGYARELYSTLHDADRKKVSLILIERPPYGAEWDAIRDRLTRAAAMP